jgi:hypothetical protein
MLRDIFSIPHPTLQPPHRALGAMKNLHSFLDVVREMYEPFIFLLNQFDQSVFLPLVAC